MYQARLNYFNVSRFDIDVIFRNGQIRSIYGYGVNFYYLSDVLERAITSSEDIKNPVLVEKFKGFLQQNIIPVIAQRKDLADAQGLRIRYRHWKDLDIDKKNPPDEDVVFLEIPVNVADRVER